MTKSWISIFSFTEKVFFKKSIVDTGIKVHYKFPNQMRKLRGEGDRQGISRGCQDLSYHKVHFTPQINVCLVLCFDSNSEEILHLCNLRVTNLADMLYVSSLTKMDI